MPEPLESAFSSVFRSLLEAAAESAIPEIEPLFDFVPPLPEPADLTWMKTYAVKPEWWYDPEEPRCDYCGVHCEDRILLSEYGAGWCGICSQCRKHCEC